MVHTFYMVNFCVCAVQLTHRLPGLWTHCQSNRNVEHCGRGCAQTVWSFTYWGLNRSSRTLLKHRCRTGWRGERPVMSRTDQTEQGSVCELLHLRRRTTSITTDADHVAQKKHKQTAVQMWIEQHRAGAAASSCQSISNVLLWDPDCGTEETMSHCLFVPVCVCLLLCVLSLNVLFGISLCLLLVAFRLFVVVRLFAFIVSVVILWSVCPGFNFINPWSRTTLLNQAVLA